MMPVECLPQTGKKTGDCPDGKQLPWILVSDQPVKELRQLFSVYGPEIAGKPAVQPEKHGTDQPYRNRGQQHPGYMPKRSGFPDADSCIKSHDDNEEKISDEHKNQMNIHNT